MKFFIILCVFNIMLFSNTIRNCNEQYKHAWNLFLNGQVNQAEKEIYTCVLSSKVTEDWINVLKAEIFLQKNENEKVIKVLRESKGRIIELFNDRNIYSHTKKSKNDVKLLYLHMLITSGYANANLNNCQEAIDDFTLYSNEFKNPNVLSYTGICYYKLNFFHKAITTLKEAYIMDVKSPLKEGIAYNIAAIYAVKGDIKNVEQWLDEPLKKNYLFYKNEIAKDTDFNKLRNHPAILKLLED